MSDEPLAMGTLEAMMSRMMQNLAMPDEVKELSSVLSSRMDEVTKKVDKVSTRLETIEDDVKNFKQQVQRGVESNPAEDDPDRHTIEGDFLFGGAGVGQHFMEGTSDTHSWMEPVRQQP